MQSALQTDKELVGDLLNGQSAAFTTLYSRHRPYLFSLLIRLVKDQELAEDLLQDTFLKSWLNIHQYDPLQGRLSIWLSTIARNLALDVIRQQKRRRNAAPKLNEADNDCCYSTASEGLVHYSLTKYLVPKYRKVIDLAYGQAYTHQEIAAELGLPLGTVKTRCRVALQQLRGALQQDIRQYHNGRPGGTQAQLHIEPVHE